MEDHDGNIDDHDGDDVVFEGLTTRNGRVKLLTTRIGQRMPSTLFVSENRWGQPARAFAEGKTIDGRALDTIDPIELEEIVLMVARTESKRIKTCGRRKRNRQRKSSERKIAKLGGAISRLSL